MTQHQSKPKLGKIAVVYDPRLSRQRSAGLARILNEVRQFAHVKLINGNVSEEELLQELETHRVQLVLVPWYRYLSWSKVEAFYGLTRTSGPTIAGYHFNQIQPNELRAPDHMRMILLEFGNPSSNDVARLVRTLLVDTQRSGIRPLLSSSTAPVYFEDWTDQFGLGHRIDAVFGIPEIGKTDWIERAGALRVVLGALWSLIYEEGPGKSGFAQTINASKPKAYFQVGAGTNFLAMRLVYSMPSWCSKDALSFFWPNPETPSAPAQLLLRYTDYLRVHHVSDTSEIEIVVGFSKEASAERHFGKIHTFWVEPLAAHLVQEPAFERPGPNSKHLKPLLTALPQRPDQVATAAREKALIDLSSQLNELKRTIREKDDLITGLRAGGVGTAKPLAPADTGSLLDAFLERFYAGRNQINDCEEEILRLEAEGIDPRKSADPNGIYLRMMKLIRNEQEWARKLAEALRSYAESKKKGKKAA